MKVKATPDPCAQQPDCRSMSNEDAAVADADIDLMSQELDDMLASMGDDFAIEEDSAAQPTVTPEPLPEQPAAELAAGVNETAAPIDAAPLPECLPAPPTEPAPAELSPSEPATNQQSEGEAAAAKKAAEDEAAAKKAAEDEAAAAKKAAEDEAAAKKALEDEAAAAKKAAEDEAAAAKKAAGSSGLFGRKIPSECRRLLPCKIQ